MLQVRLGRHSSDAVAVCSLDKRSESFFDGITALLREGKTAAQVAEDLERSRKQLVQLGLKRNTLQQRVAAAQSSRTVQR